MIMNKLESICKKVIQMAISAEEYGWPPGCQAILYQPERPLSEREKKPDEHRHEEKKATPM